MAPEMRETDANANYARMVAQQYVLELVKQTGLRQ